MKRLLLSALFLSATASAEGEFIGGGLLYADQQATCELRYCGQVSVELDVDAEFSPINTNLDVASEAYFNPNLGGYFYSRYVADNGSVYIDKDETAGQYTDSGFYLLTKSFAYGRLPQEDTIDVSNVNFTFDDESDTVSLSFDWASDKSPYGEYLQYGVYANTDRNLNEHLSYWRVEAGNERRVVVKSSTPLDRIDVHAVVAGEEYNFAMTEAYDNFYIWDFPPTVADDQDMIVFFNYDVNGTGIDTEVFESNTTDLGEIYTVFVNPYYDTISLTDEVTYTLMGEAGVDNDTIENVNLMYKVNGGPLQAYTLTREVIQSDIRLITGYVHSLNVDIATGDVIEYSYSYTYNGVAYTAAWETKEL